MSNTTPIPCDFTDAEIAEAKSRIDLTDHAFDLLYRVREDLPDTTILAVYMLRLEKAKNTGLSLGWGGYL